MNEMNQVELKVMEVKLPEVIFNEKEIVNYLEGVLEKYNGLVFTEDTAKDCKATVTELNKMVKAVDAFRLKYKKDLSAPISEFETKCKSLITQIEEVQTPLKEQAEKFEVQRKENRRIEIKGFVDEALSIVPLEPKWLSKFALKEEWLNVSLSNSKVKQAIMADIEKLAAEQKSYYDKIEVVNTKCELHSMKLGLQVALIPDNFYHLCDNYDGPEIDNKIFEIAQKNLVAEKEAIAKIEAVAKEKAEKEAAVVIEAAKKEAQTQVNAAVEMASEVAQSVEKFIPVEKTESEKMYKATFETRGSKAQLEALIGYMEASGIQYTKL